MQYKFSILLFCVLGPLLSFARGIRIWDICYSSRDERLFAMLSRSHVSSDCLLKCLNSKIRIICIFAEVVYLNYPDLLREVGINRYYRYIHQSIHTPCARPHKLYPAYDVIQTPITSTINMTATNTIFHNFCWEGWKNYTTSLLL